MEANEEGGVPAVIIEAARSTIARMARIAYRWGVELSRRNELPFQPNQK